jgi:Protein of unknown function (DUF3455)
MTHCHAQTPQTPSRRWWRMSIAALAGAYLALLPPGLSAYDLTPPAVPAGLEVPVGHAPFLQGYATGTQNYICLPDKAGPGVVWTLFGPQATLFDDDALQIITHFLSPNPEERGTPRATWQHSQDTSTVWAMKIASSSDVGFVASGAIPWLLLQVVGADRGPTGGHSLTETTYLQRVHTLGGLAPTTGCVRAKDMGNQALVPYSADYVFHTATGSQ